MSAHGGAELDMTYASDFPGGLPWSPGKVVERHNEGAYKFVRFDNGSGNVTPQKGDVVVYKGDTGYGAGTITTDYSDGNVAAGVLISEPPDQGYCWIQIRGSATLRQALENSPADGVGLTLGASDGTLALWDNSGTNDRPVVATCIDASAKRIACNFVY